ncbi:FAD-dependent oxidoreductase [Agrilactobacillus yilanensis]|uniref:FAD-dependent oxidoreductase n=1 Tax=Agrilactobacillus yilanensis TaxID=2485997 RepID=A0ABW4J438_9LACO|nr:FAD-dependent oxidoreductase [Agrilactobacillus yilanensis]
MAEEKHIYDTVIVGAGPAGLSAGIYAGRATLDTLIVEADQVGGQVTTTSVVANYPAVPEISGTALMQKMQQQCSDFGVKITSDNITNYELEGDVKILHGQKNDYAARSVILATGANPRELGFPGEKEFRGRGVAYCSTCDGELFSGLQVFVVGGGYAAAEEANYLTRYAKHVTILVRKGEFKCPPLVAAPALENPKIDVKYHTEVVKASGTDYLTDLVLKNNETGEETTYHVDDGDATFGIFVFVGTTPATADFRDKVDCDQRGYVLADNDQKTNIEGVYAAGDVVSKELRQIITAASDGATAATSAEHYVTALKQKLGLPLHTAAPKAKAPKQMGQSSEVPAAEKEAPVHQGKWFSSEIIQQLSPIFGKLTKPVTLKFYTDGSNKAQSLESFAEEFSQMSDLISFEKSNEQPEGRRLPSLELLDENGQARGVQFSGIPSGHELNSLVLAIYNLAGPGQTIDPELIERIKQLPERHIEIAIALTCHFCPDVVSACQHIAILNPKVSAEMIDLQEFPDYRKAHHIMSVPATRINGGETIFGSQTLEQLVAACESAEAVTEG